MTAHTTLDTTDPASDPKSHDRIKTIAGVSNFRDLGGYRNRTGQSVRWGKMYRSAQLDRLSTQGVEQLKALNIKTVVDLRFSEESEKYPTMEVAVPRAQMLSWHAEKLNEMQQNVSKKNVQNNANPMLTSWREALESKNPSTVREAMRINYPQKLYSHAAIYQKMLRALLADETPLVFHCAAGKDRTGVAAALILGLLNVDNDTIIKDYLVTQSQMGALIETWMAGGATAQDSYNDFQQRLVELPRELVQPVFDADPDYITTLLDYVEQTYGDFFNYAQNQLEFTRDEIDELQHRLLT